MQIDQLELTNFRCFKKQTLRLSKITVLLGANSSGKSSLLHGVLAAIQTDQFPLRLSANGDLVDLGDFRGLVHRRRAGNEVGIGLTLRDETHGQVKFAGSFRRSSRTGMPEVNEATISSPAFSAKITHSDKFRVRWAYNEDADNISKLLWSTNEFREIMVGIVNAGIQMRRASAPQSSQPKNFSNINNADFAKLINSEAPASGSFVTSSLTDLFADFNRPERIKVGMYTSQLSGLVRQLRTEFNYIGSFRLEPRRTYYQIAKGDLRISREGQNTIEQIADWQDRRADQLVELSEALARLKLLAHVETALLPSGLFEVKARPKPRSTPVSLPDVGFGIGQLLPILVADLQLPQNGTLAVSQPEIHLHPSVQADLADHFVRNIKSKTTRYIIETHSEYFLNRLRALIANGELASEDLSVVYLSNNGLSTVVHEIHLLPDGRIDGAPRDFFETYMVDVMNIALSASTK